MGKFWISDDFIRKHARYLSGGAQRVYMALSSHVNKQSTTFIGQRKIAEYLGLSKTTVNEAIKELKAYQLLVRLTDKENGKPYQIKLLTVPNEVPKPYQLLVHKEDIKENYKEEGEEEKREYKGRERMLDALKEYPGLYQQFKNKKIST